MRVDFVPGMTNVVRFPSERRARSTLDLLRDIVPDIRRVLNLAETFGMEAAEHDLRAQVDAATAEHILNQVPPDAAAREAMFAETERPVVERAVQACRAAYDAEADAAAAQEALLRAQPAGGCWVEPLREKAEVLTRRAVELLIVAHARSEEAEGVARAVGLARRGQAWVPRDIWAETEDLIALEVAAAAG
jgi:phosphoglycolate phosphatase-like HAD superfamily hydrolase